MSIVIDNQTPVLVQGFTGRIGSFHSKEMMEYGRQLQVIVAEREQRLDELSLVMKGKQISV